MASKTSSKSNCPFLLTGRLVYSKSFGHQSDGDQNLSVNLPKKAINNGLYLIEIISNFENGYLKLLVSE